MFDLDRWTEIGMTLRNNRLRTFLTAAGVFWGMFMLVAMLGFGSGLQRGVMRDMTGFATNSVFVWGGRTSMPYNGLRPGRRIAYDNGDVEAVRQIEGIRHLAPRNQLGGYREGRNVVRGSRTGNYRVMGDMPVIAEIDPAEFDQGRFLNRLDVEGYRKVAVIGTQVQQELFEPGEDPIGAHLQINGVYFQVVGVFRSLRTDDRGDRENSTLFIPFTTFQRAFNYGDRVGWMAITGEPGVDASELEERVREVLSRRHDVHPDDTNGIGSFNAQEEYEKVVALFTGIQFFVWFVGVMTLAAGVVGVSNIMLIVVRERTSEIGLRRAIGATPASVVWMILQESVALTAVAGYAGLVAGVALLEVAGMFLDDPASTMAPPAVDLGTALAAGLVLLIAGALAGVIPARNAAAIEPVEALHAE